LPVLVPILMYHRVADAPQGAEGAGLVVSPAELTAQAKWLAARGWRGVALRELAAALAGDTRLPSRSIVFTFDDGAQDVLDNALPILKQYAWSATLFVSSSLAGKRGEHGAELADWPALRLAAQQGFEIGSHGAGHRRLAGLSDGELEREVAGSRAEIAARLGMMPPETFAYPYGSLDPRALAAVERAGYLAAVTTEGGVLHAPAQRCQLRRVAVYRGLDPERFGRRLGLLYELHQRLARLFRPRPDVSGCAFA